MKLISSTFYNFRVWTFFGTPSIKYTFIKIFITIIIEYVWELLHDCKNKVSKSKKELGII